MFLMHEPCTIPLALWFDRLMRINYLEFERHQRLQFSFIPFDIFENTIDSLLIFGVSYIITSVQNFALHKSPQTFNQIEVGGISRQPDPNDLRMIFQPFLQYF